MAVKQTTVILSNHKGTLLEVTDILAKEKIDIRSVCIADSEQFGVIRMITGEPDRAAEVLKSAGYLAKSREVVAVSVSDEPGKLNEILHLLDQAGINLEYMYSVINPKLNRANMVLRVSDNEKTEEYLREHGVEVLDDTSM